MALRFAHASILFALGDLWHSLMAAAAHQVLRISTCRMTGPAFLDRTFVMNRPLNWNPTDSSATGQVFSRNDCQLSPWVSILYAARELIFLGLLLLVLAAGVGALGMWIDMQRTKVKLSRR